MTDCSREEERIIFRSSSQTTKMSSSSIALILALVASAAANSYGSQQQQQLAQQQQQPAFVGSYSVEDDCQYKLCGSGHYLEFGSGRPEPESCAGECDALSRRLLTSKFKREFMWGECADMCADKYGGSARQESNAISGNEQEEK